MNVVYALVQTGGLYSPIRFSNGPVRLFLDRATPIEEEARVDARELSEVSGSSFCSRIFTFAPDLVTVGKRADGNFYPLRLSPDKVKWITNQEGVDLGVSSFESAVDITKRIAQRKGLIFTYPPGALFFQRLYQSQRSF